MSQELTSKPESAPRRRRLACALVAVLVTAVSVYLRMRTPVLIGNYETDSVLFVRLANSIVGGHWLGSFNTLTLFKGPMYPVFIALCHNLGVPLKLAEHATYLAAGLALAGCIWLVTGRLVASTIAYVVIALDPASFGVVNAILMRDGWYSSLSLLLVCTIFLACFTAVNGGPRWVPLPFAVIAGLVMAAFWMCREEGPWIVPSALVIFVSSGLSGVLRWRRAARENNEPSSPLRHSLSVPGIATFVAVAVLFGISFAAPIKAIEVRNQHVYGAPLVTDMAQGTIPQAYAEWERVKAETRPKYVPISTAQRMAVYQVSPAARELEPYLENMHNVWAQISCGGSLAHCDYTGAFTIWAIRAAAQTEGHFSTEADAQRFFGQLAQQIDTACATRQLSCQAKLPSSLQSIDGMSLTAFTKSAWHMATMLYWSPGFVTLPTGDDVHANQLAIAHAVIPDAPATPEAGTQQRATYQRSNWPYRWLIATYRILLPLLLVAAIVGMLLTAIVTVVRRRRARNAVWILAAALLIGVGMRLALLATIDVTQYPAAQARYLLPARDCLLGFTMVGLGQLAKLVADEKLLSGVNLLGLTRKQPPVRSDLGEAHGETDHDELQAADDEHGAEDGQPDRGPDVELTEASHTPVRQRDEVQHDADEHAEAAKDQAALQGDPVQGTLDPRADGQ